ncbi:MAG: NAD-dependent epimerase/dehydratase family protein [Gemmatimonadales bacterium]|nr:NAD-dependent epimerase/dehydratase family protein [Gemmatimonadota bacterium]MCL4214379.1 NAD-dependent epimerase/dehydratase family protein [Gemmatimonadales bacterium]
MTTRNALVTGGAGFIGSHVADALIAEGWSVTVLDNLSSGKREQVPAKARFVEADIRSPEAAACIREGAFDLVCHLAAQIDVRKSVTDPKFDVDVNIGGSVNLMSAVHASGRKTRFIFASTGGAVYGDFVEPPNLETYAKDPESPYGIAKFAAELYLAYYARVHGLDYVSLRFANVYGPRQDPHGEAGVVAIFCGRLLKGTPLTVFGDGGQTRDYVYVGDVARAHVLAAGLAPIPPGKVDDRAFNLGTQQETSVVDLARILMAAAKKSVPLEHAAPRPGEQRRSVVSIEKARNGLGWSPQVSLEDGLRRTYDYFAAR